MIEAPDGQRYVAVLDEEADRMLEPIATRAVALIEEPVPHWVDVAHTGVLANVVASIVEDDVDHASPETRRVAYTAARLGWAARIAECELLGLVQSNDELKEFLERVRHTQALGKDWFATVCGAAGTLMNGTNKDPFNPTLTTLLGQTSLGIDMTRRLGLVLVANVLVNPELDQRRDVGGLGTMAFLESWRFGYYLRLCTESLPTAAAEELAAL